MNTFQVEALVSHGYIVVGIDQPGVAALVIFPDGHQIAVPSILNATNATDPQRILAGKLDL